MQAVSGLCPYCNLFLMSSWRGGLTPANVNKYSYTFTPHCTWCGICVYVLPNKNYTCGHSLRYLQYNVVKGIFAAYFVSLKNIIQPVFT